MSNRARATAAAHPQDRRRLAVLAAALLAALALVLGAAAVGPADAASAAVSAGKPDKPGKPGGGSGGDGGGGSTELAYAALGDSFAAGVGAGSYLERTCYTSSKSYPKLLDADADKQLVAFPACSGKDTVDVLSRQVAAVPTTAKVVTVTVGGNDVGFAGVMQNCFVLLNNASCASAISTGAAIAESDEFAASIASVVTSVASRAPGAKVIVTGYPLLFWENTSGVNPKYSWADEVNDETVVLNDVIESVATANGAVFIDVEDDFAGHGIGSSSPWINDWKWLTTTTVNAFHPNAAGHAAYATAIRAVPLS
jgi:lysophospholipase L1-like esterase